MTTATADTLNALPETRSELLRFLKQQGTAALAQMATHLGTTREAVRQQLALLEQEGWVQRVPADKHRKQGRPAASFALTPAGDHLFPKNYDGLSLELIDTVLDQLGTDVLRQMLAALTDKQVAQWQKKLAGLSLTKRIEALKGIYFENDPFTTVEKDARGYMLVERNCPFLNIAGKRPQLCSITVATLTRLLGVKVRREARFQDGDRRCVFRVLADEPVDKEYRFEFESQEK